MRMAARAWGSRGLSGPASPGRPIIGLGVRRTGAFSSCRSAVRQGDCDAKARVGVLGTHPAVVQLQNPADDRETKADAASRRDHTDVDAEKRLVIQSQQILQRTLALSPQSDMSLDAALS